MYDGPPPNSRPPLTRELTDGTAHVGVKIALTIVLIAMSTAGALLGGYFLAALNPSWDRYRGNYGAQPTDELMIAMAVFAGVACLSAVAWLWSRGRTNRSMIYAIVLTFAIIGGTIGLGVLAESALQGDDELVIAGIVFFGFAALLLLWVFALRHRGPKGRPARNAQDGLLDVLCPACGYRMVGLRESRCPECGAEYTLDELLTRQRFAPPPAFPPIPSSPPAGIPPLPQATENQASPASAPVP